MDIAITRMSSKGQIVIPAEMRLDIPAGEKLLLIKSERHFILKKARDLDKSLAEDLVFAQRTEEAWKRHRQGKSKRMEREEFLKELARW